MYLRPLPQGHGLFLPTLGCVLWKGLEVPQQLELSQHDSLSDKIYYLDGFRLANLSIYFLCNMVAIILTNSCGQFKTLVMFFGQGSSNSYPFFHSSISSSFRKHDSNFSMNLST